MSELEKDARTIFFETLKAVDLPAMIRRRVRLEGDLLWFDAKAYDLARFGELILVGIGKASLQMGQAIESLLGGRLTRGLLVTNRRAPQPLRSEVMVAGHPVPDAQSLRAGKHAIEILAGCLPDSLIIFLISGGGSALLEVPVSDEITLEDLQQLNRILVECGATIEEINVVRKQFSAVKGGRLRRWVKANEVVALLVSDVNAGDHQTLASNPLLPEASRVEQFQAITKKYRLTDLLPRLLQRYQSASKASAREFDEGHEAKIETILLAENADVVEGAARVAQELGYVVRVDRADDEASVDETASRLTAAVLDLKRACRDQKVCVVSGEEISCPVKGPGFGGRNQEFALRCALKMKEALTRKSLVLSCGTDGIDGRSIAVGAFATASRTSDDKLDEARLRPFFEASDTASWFSETGGLLVTGPTGNNLRDLRVILTT